MKKLLRYLVNTILFVVIFSIPTIFIMGYAVSQYGTRPNALSAFGPILGLLIAYILVKKINKSNLWASLFDETEVCNKVVDEKKVKVEKEGSYNWKLISIVTIIVAGLVYFNTFYFTEIPQETVNKDNELELINQKFIQAEKNGNLLSNRYNIWTDLNDPNADIVTLKLTYQPVTGIVYGVGNITNDRWESAYINGVQEGLSKWWDRDGYLFSIYLFQNGFPTYKKNFKEGVLISIDIYEKSSYKIKRTITH